MKFARTLHLLIAILAVLAVGACGDQVEYDQVAQESAPAQQSAAPAMQAASSNAWAGEVLETMNSGGYSYVRFVKDGKEVWAAGPEMGGLAVGDKISMAPGMMMQNFHAKSLDRDFAEIYFVGKIEKADHTHTAADNSQGGMTSTPTSANPAAAARTVLESAGVEPVDKAEGGFTVAEIHEQGAKLNGQNVLIRGRVVKFSPNIMGTNWVHIQDGTGEGPTCDLTITTSGRVASGDVVLVEGKLSADKDFGAGYRYTVIVEDAQVTKQ